MRKFVRAGRGARFVLGGAAAVTVTLAACVPTGPGGGGGTTTTTTTTVPPGTPTRTFLQRTDVQPGVNVRNATAADLNGDGRKDLVGISGTPSASVVSVQLANASGGFAAHVDYAAGVVVMGFALGDVTDDGRTDVVAANGGNGTVSVLPGNGDGTFGAAVVTTVGGTLGNYNSQSVIVLGDLDGDTHLDGVVSDAGGSNRVVVLHGVGDGTFTATAATTPGQKSRAVELADMNGDGDLDLVAMSDDNPLNIGSGTLSVHLGGGNGTFGAGSQQPVPTTTYDLAAGDFTGDGDLDVATVPYFSATYAANLFTFVGLGDGTIAPFGTTSSVVEGQTEAVAFADLDTDGRADLVAADLNANVLSVSLSNGDGTFAAPAGYATPNLTTSSLRRTVTVADMTGDGRADLVWSDGRQGSVSIFRTRADGTLAAMGRMEKGGGIDRVIAEVTGDGAADVVVANDSFDNIDIYPGRGDGTLLPVVKVPTGSKPSGIAVADLDGNGTADLVTSNRTANTVSVHLGTGGGTFAARVAYATGVTPNGVVVANVAGDARPDIVTVDVGGGGVSVLVNNGSGAFAAPVAHATSAAPYGVAAADLDGDADVDLAVSNSSGATVSVLLNTGGSFATHVDYATGVAPRRVRIADVNGDAKADLVVAAFTGSALSTLLGNGDGTFQAKIDSPTSANVSNFTLADFDGDGRTDAAIATENPVGSRLPAGWMRGDGLGGFGSPTTFPVASGSQQFGAASGDLNGDGAPDFVFAENNVMLWLLTG